jgi:hypothetical protein
MPALGACPRRSAPLYQVLRGVTSRSLRLERFSGRISGQSSAISPRPTRSVQPSARAGGLEAGHPLAGSPARFRRTILHHPPSMYGVLSALPRSGREPP